MSTALVWLGLSASLDKLRCEGCFSVGLYGYYVLSEVVFRQVSLVSRVNKISDCVIVLNLCSENHPLKTVSLKVWSGDPQQKKGIILH